jgi:hypothetical protein
MAPWLRMQQGAISCELPRGTTVHEAETGLQPLLSPSQYISIGIAGRRPRPHTGRARRKAKHPPARENPEFRALSEEGKEFGRCCI